MGYDFEMLNINLANYHNIIGLYKGMKKIAPKTNLFKILKALPSTAKMVIQIDKVEDYMRKNMGFEINDGDFEKAHKAYLAQLRQARD